MTCDEPVRADLGFETLECRRDFCKIRWFRQIKRMDSTRLPGKLLEDEWDGIKSRGRPRKSWFSQVSALMKELSRMSKQSKKHSKKKSVRILTWPCSIIPNCMPIES